MTDRQVAVLRQRRMEGKTQETVASLARSRRWRCVPMRRCLLLGQETAACPHCGGFPFLPTLRSFFLIVLLGTDHTLDPIHPWLRDLTVDNDHEEQRERQWNLV